VNDPSGAPAGPAPLAGVRVLDVSRFVSGPLCTFLLASMGAEVISVESPRTSTSRRLPPFAHPEGGSTNEYVDGAMSIPFLKRSRGKRSVALDVTRSEGSQVARALAAQSDVLVENSRSDAMTGFGLGYEQLATVNPRLVYCAISGYGYDAPERPAMDNIVQAASGVMAKTGFPDGPPVRAGITIADHASATYAALGILAALRQRDATGAGQLVDVAMIDVLTASVWDEPVDHYAAIGLPPRTGNADGRGAPINTYRCADGWISVTCTSDAQWQRVCDLMDRDDALAQWPTIRERAGAAGEIDAAMEAWTSKRPVREVEDAFLAVGLPSGRVRDPIEAAGDHNLRTRGLLTDLRHPSAPADRPSGFLGASLPISFAGRVELPPAELLGASTDAVLREIAGCSHGEIARLRAGGVIA
jgi:formyl-CoA transferase